ncbi:MAG: hypothetical protein ACLS6Y_05295 [Streptococcus salivarius]
MKISIVGITGYSGLELVKILNNHKKVELVSIHATKEVGRRLSDVYPYLTGICDLELKLTMRKDYAKGGFGFLCHTFRSR